MACIELTIRSICFIPFSPFACAHAGLGAAIKCYRCTVNPTEQTCRQFDEGDDRYIVDCPYSTMCQKKVYRLKLTDGTNSETVSRDCAKQKYTEEVGFVWDMDENAWKTHLIQPFSAQFAIF